jgi:hypothetical protein
MEGAKHIPLKILLPAAVGLAVAATVVFSLFSYDSAWGLWQFAGALIVCFFAPGYILLRLSGAAARIPLVKRVVLAFAVGIVVSSALYYIFAAAGARWLFIVFVTAATAVVLLWAVASLPAIRKTLSGGVRLTKARAVFAILALAILACAIPASFTSGMRYDDGIRFYGYHSMDSMWHLARIAEIEHTVPPQNPMDAASPLAYHVLYHTAVNALHGVSGVNFFDIHFRLMPAFMLTLFASVLYITVRKISNRRTVALWAVALFFFAGDLGFIFLVRKAEPGPALQQIAAGDVAGGASGLSAALDRAITIHDRGDMYYEVGAFQGGTFTSVFWSETTLISLVLLFVALHFFCDIAPGEGEKRMHYGAAILGALCIGAMMQTKVQVGLLALAALLPAALFLALRGRGLAYLKFFAIAVAFAALFAIPWITAFKHEDPAIRAGGRYTARAPVALTTKPAVEHIRSMLVLPGLNAWKDAREIAPPVLAILWLVSIIFMFGGRIIGLPFIVGSFSKNRGAPAEIVMALMIVLGLFLAHFTEMLGESLFSSHFIAGIILVNYFGARGMTWLGDRRSRIVGLAAQAALLLLVLPMPVFKFVSELPRNNLYAVVDRDEEELYARLREITPPDAAVLRRVESNIALRDSRGGRVDETPGDSFLMAFAGRRVVVIQDKGFDMNREAQREEMLSLSPKVRDVYELFRTSDGREACEIIGRSGATHLVLFKGDELRFDASALFEEEYSNGAGKIFRVREDFRATKCAGAKE